MKTKHGARRRGFFYYPTFRERKPRENRGPFLLSNTFASPLMTFCPHPRRLLPFCPHPLPIAESLSMPLDAESSPRHCPVPCIFFQSCVREPLWSNASIPSSFDSFCLVRFVLLVRYVVLCFSGNFTGQVCQPTKLTINSADLWQFSQGITCRQSVYKPYSVLTMRFLCPLFSAFTV